MSTMIIVVSLSNADRNFILNYIGDQIPHHLVIRLEELTLDPKGFVHGWLGDDDLEELIGNLFTLSRGDDDVEVREAAHRIAEALE